MLQALDDDLADCVRVRVAGVKRNLSRHASTVTDDHVMRNNGAAQTLKKAPLIERDGLPYKIQG